MNRIIQLLTMVNTLRCVDERKMPTSAITPMEQEMLNELTRGQGLPDTSIEFRQRVSAYHLRYQFWKQLPPVAFNRIKAIAEKHGYKCVESENGPDDDRMTRWCYDLIHTNPSL